METATAVRWRKYGKDRLYINAASGERIGWRDLITGQDHIEVEGSAELFSMTVATWLASQQHGSMPVGGKPLDNGPAMHRHLDLPADVPPGTGRP